MSLSGLKLETLAVHVAGHDLAVTVPSSPEDVLEASAQHDGGPAADPYWGILWPAARKTAAVLLKHYAAPVPQKTLEIGCGAGLTGIAALTCGHSVTFSDVVPEAVELAVRNAHQNGFSNVDGLVLDWRKPIEEKFDLIVGSDVLYDVRSHQPLFDVIERMLTADGQVILGDTGRGHAICFYEQALRSRWRISVLDQQYELLSQPVRQQFQVFRLQRAGPLPDSPH